MYYNIFSPKFLNNMKGKIFTILFSMLVFVALAAPPTIIPDPPLQNESFSIVASIDYAAPFIYDDVVDFQTMSTDVSIIPKDVSNIAISSDIIVAWIKDKDPGYDHCRYISTNKENILIRVDKHYDPGRCD